MCISSSVRSARLGLYHILAICSFGAMPLGPFSQLITVVEIGRIVVIVVVGWTHRMANNSGGH